MPEKLFWIDPYRCSCDAVVRSVDGDLVTLDQTVFFALAGGQESDAGTIAGLPVLEARKVGSEILYRLPADHRLKAGSPARVEIDWERRYRLMRLHFAAEIVLELVYRALPGIVKVGAHIAVDKARLDFDWPTSLAPLLPGLTAEAQAVVDRDEAIVSAFSDVATERRYWEVPGFARIPCGGTHLRRTSEVGILTLKRKNPGKGKERIEIYLDSAV